MLPGKKLLILLFASTFLVACSRISEQKTTPIKSTSQPLSFPSAFYDTLVYFDDRLVAFSLEPNEPPSNRISFAYEGDTKLHLFQPIHDMTCSNKATYNVMGGVLPDGRLGILRDCFLDAPSVTRSIFAYNWQTGVLERIVKGPIANGLLPRTFTWNPQMTKGVQQMGNGIQGTIYWISSDGASPMDIEIEDQGLKWNLRDYFEGKKRVGSAGTPAWSPDGSTIAFFASSYGIREEPLPKMNAEHELYIMNVSDLRPVQVVPRIANAFQLHWSPDSTQLLFSGCMRSPLQCGMWLYNVETKSLALVEEGDFQDFTWITDEKIAAIKNITMPFDNNQIWEYSLSQ